MSSLWFEVESIKAKFSDYVIVSDPETKKYISETFNIEKNKVIDNINSRETISIDKLIPNYNIYKLRKLIGEGISEKVKTTLDIWENILYRKNEEEISLELELFCSYHSISKKNCLKRAIAPITEVGYDCAELILFLNE